MNCIKAKFSLLILLFLSACATGGGPQPGPDKQGLGLMQGALTGAGTGAIAGAQLSAATGPGALVGAGFGAVAGSVRGMMQDNLEELTLKQEQATFEAKEVARAQELLNEHYRRRLDLHPTRDIYPADWFFYADSVKLRPEALALVYEIVRMNKERMPSSRIVVAAYAMSKDENSEYAKHLTDGRSREIVNYFVRAGLDSRRVETRPVVVSEPVLIDPLDKIGRYNQAIEIIHLDR